MKEKIHPPYQQVLFVDSASGHRFICGSTLKSEAKEKFEGVEYPVIYLSISSTSHPFFTGSKQLVDSEGRVEKFKKRFDRKKDKEAESSSTDVEASQPAKAVASAPAKPAAKAPAEEPKPKKAAAPAPAKKAK